MPKKQIQNMSDLARLARGMTEEQIAAIPLDQKRELAKYLMEEQRRYDMRKLERMYPATGPLSRDKYQKHMRFFLAGKTCNMRAILAGNRVGKSYGIGGYETALHLTGLYPDWWPGKRFTRPVLCWAAGKTALKTRDIAQYILLGQPGKEGTGLVPGDKIGTKRSKQGVPDAVDSVHIRHINGTDSRLVFKSYAEGYEGFQGEEPDIIWLDEEPPMLVNSECVMRTMPTRLRQEPGHVLYTFTPQEGMSEVVMSFIPDGQLPDPDTGHVTGNRFVIMAGWDDVPHLSKVECDALLANIPEYQRLARSKGIPQLGAGAVWPFSEDQITCDPIKIEPWFKRIYGFDVGWNNTAAFFLAKNPDDKMVYAYTEYKQGRAEPAIHIDSIKARGGKWMPGKIDPASAGSSQVDGRNLKNIYCDSGLYLSNANNSVEAGVFAVEKAFSEGTLKIFKTCKQFLGEFRLYRRNEKGRIVKENDHLCDCLRYAYMSINEAIEVPDEDVSENSIGHIYRGNTNIVDTTAGWY